MVNNRMLAGVVTDQGEIEIEGELLSFQDGSQAIPPGTSVMVTIGQCITCLRLKEHQQIADERIRIEKEESAKRQKLLDEEKSNAWAFNAALKLPVPWSVGIKDVLSGLSERSNGDGYNRATVEHIVLEQDLVVGRLKRSKGDFLCTSASRDNGKSWSGATSSAISDGQGGTYAPKVSCKACLKLAQRFQNFSLEP